jgi:hypothetical protein
MVPALEVTLLAQAFEELKSQTTRVQGRSGLESDVAFDMISTDSFLAGIATRLLKGKPRLSPEERKTLQNALSRNGAWLLAGNEVPLRQWPELSRYGELLEKVRSYCLKVAAARGT